MKKALPYIIGSLVIAVLVLLVISNRKNTPRQLEERLSFRRFDKIPYGMYVAYEGLNGLFSNARLFINRDEPGTWDSLSVYEDAQALIIITPRFSANESEMRQLISFASNGNDVFISSRELSQPCLELINANAATTFFSSFMDDSLAVTLAAPPFTKSLSKQYPGRRFDSYFTAVDTSITQILGYNNNNRPNFIRLRAGRGNIYIHLAPLAFSNYFLMHANNISYYESAFSVLSGDTRTIAWDEYFLRKRSSENDQPRRNWFSALFKEPSIGAGLTVLLLLLLVYVLLEMRRKQRIIPVVTKPVNDSLDFVKTIGRLYHDKKDHRDLARKMGSYFLEHVRSRYALSTSRLDEGFIKSLHYKSGFDASGLQEIVTFINFIDKVSTISDHQLHHFYKQLELFYKTT